MNLGAKSYSKTSWKKIIAENVFGIDTTEKSNKDTNAELVKQMRAAYVASGMGDKAQADTMS
jgi:hypothetical protein